MELQIQAIIEALELFLYHISQKSAHLDIGKHLRWHDRFGHCASRHLYCHSSAQYNDCSFRGAYWGNSGGANVVLLALTSEGLCEANQAHLCSTIVCLTEVAWASSDLDIFDQYLMSETGVP